MKEIDVNGSVLSVNAGVTALTAVEMIRDMGSLQGGRILENGTRMVLDTEILSELTGRLSFYGGQRVGTDRNMTSLFFLIPVTDPNKTLYVFLCLSSYTARCSPTSR